MTDPKNAALRDTARRFHQLIEEGEQNGTLEWMFAVQEVWGQLLVAAGAVGLNATLLRTLTRVDHVTYETGIGEFDTIDAVHDGRYVAFTQLEQLLGATPS